MQFKGVQNSVMVEGVESTRSIFTTSGTEIRTKQYHEVSKQDYYRQD